MSKSALGCMLGVVVMTFAGPVLADPDPAETEAEQREELGPMGEEPPSVLTQELDALDAVIHFGFGSSALRPEAQRELDQLASALQQAPDRRVLIAGHTDYVGGDRYNFGLGGLRAQAVRSYLVEAGVESDRITVVSVGETESISRENAENRRVRLFLEGPREEEERPEVAQLGPGAPQPEEEEVEPFEEPREEEEEIPPEEPAAPIPPAELPPEEEEERPPGAITRHGAAVQVGGGVLDFVEEDTRDVTGTAGTWEARFIYGTRSRIGVEAAYVGAAQEIRSLAAQDDATLITTNFEGAVRLNSDPLVGFLPYAFAGVGVARYDVTDQDQQFADVDDDETAFNIPLGLGIGYRWQRFTADIRGTYRQAFDDSLMRPAGDNASLHSWSATARVGFEF